MLENILESPLHCKSSHQSILNTINPEYSLEGLMLRLKLQYFGHLMRRTDSLKKTLMLGKIKGRRRRGLQRKKWLGGSMNMSLSKLRRWRRTEEPGVLHPWRRKDSDTTERQNHNNLATCLLGERCCPSPPVQSSSVLNSNFLALPSAGISLHLSVGTDHPPQ